MKNKFFLLLSFVLFLFITSCEGPHEHDNDAPDINAVKTALQAMEDAYAAGENAKDANAIVAYYAEDAQSLPVDEPKVVGKAAIRARLESNLAKDTTNNTISFEVVDVFAAGNLAVEVGKSVTVAPDGKQVSSGKYMSLFEKRDGKYVCIRDIWNRDAAPEKK